MESVVKEEILETSEIQSQNHQRGDLKLPSVIDLGSSSSSDSNSGYGDCSSSNGKELRVFGGDDVGEEVEGSSKRMRVADLGDVLPPGFLDELPLDDSLPFLMPEPISQMMMIEAAPVRSCRQFWKAGDYEEDCGGGNLKATTSGNVEFVLCVSCFANVVREFGFAEMIDG